MELLIQLIINSITMEKDKVNLASLARKFIGDLSDLGNEVVDNLIEPITDNKSSKKIKIRDYPRNTYQPVISNIENKRLITLYLPGVGSGDIEIKNENEVIDICACSPETFENERDELIGWGNDGRMTYHYTITVPGGYKQDTLIAQLRNGLLKVYFVVNPESGSASVVNID